MASSFSDLGLELMATGENAGTWGTKTNTNLQIIEKSIAGYVEQAVTSGGTTALSITDGDATESTSVARHAVIKLTGTITGNSIVTVPDSIEKVYIVTNGTSGAYTVQFKTASGTGITFGVSEKTTRLVYSDGTNLIDAGFGGSLDLEGRELILDADGDTSLTADTDDQIDIKIGGADDFQFTANTFTAQSGSTIAAQALTATTITASGIVKTDDTTEATSTTDGSLQTDGGLSVAKDAVIGDDLKLLSDSAVLSFGADSDTTLTHTDGTGLTLNSTNKLLFRDTGLYINSSTDGQLDLVADTEIQIAATTIDINGAIAMDGAITGATNITLSGELDAATLDISGNADIDGTTNLDAVDIDGAVQIDAAVTVGVDDTGYDFKLFGATSGSFLLWDESDDALELTDSTKVKIGDGGDMEIYHDGSNSYITNSTGALKLATETSGIALTLGHSTSEVTVADNLTVTGDLTVNGTTTTVNSTTVTIDDPIFTLGGDSAPGSDDNKDRGIEFRYHDGSNAQIGFMGYDDSATGFTFLTAATNSSEVFSGTAAKIIAGELDISGNMDIDGTANLDAVDIDGAVQLDSTFTVGADDQGYDVKLFGDTASAYMLWDTSADDLILGGAAGLIVPDGQFTLGSTAVTATAAEINLIDGGTARGTTAVADGDGLLVNDGGTMRMTNVTTLKTYFQTGISSAADDISAGDAAVNITTSSGNITIDAAANDSDIIFKGTDNSSDITMLTLDGSEAGAATFNNKVIATELDISGNCDIDGTTNLDAVDIDGAVQLDATLTIGANDQGYDVILYGDTASANITWDTSADDLIFNGAAGLIVPDGQFTLGSTAVTSTAAELNLLDGVSGLVQADLTKLAAVDSTAAELNIVDGGTSATSTTVADADRVVLNDNGTMVQVAMTDIKTYIGGGTSWQAVKTGDYTASAGQGIFANTTSASFTVTLPASPSLGDEVSIKDYAGTFDTNALTVGRNSQPIEGVAADLTVSVERAGFTLVYSDSTQGWLLKDK